MASPQKENGYTPISNELLDALSASKLTGLELRFIMHLLRNTYGYKRKEYTASLAKIGKGLGISRISAKKTADKLLAHRVIAVTPQGNKKPLTYSINKDYDSWCYPTGLQSSVTPQGNSSIPPQGNSGVVLPIIGKKKERKVKDAQIFHFKKAVSVPKNLYLTGDMISYAKEKKIIGGEKVFNEMLEQMKDWHIREGKKRNDWHATWRTWVRNHIKFYPDSIEKEKVWVD